MVLKVLSTIYHIKMDYIYIYRVYMQNILFEPHKLFKFAVLFDWRFHCNWSENTVLVSLKVRKALPDSHRLIALCNAPTHFFQCTRVLCDYLQYLYHHVALWSPKVCGRSSTSSDHMDSKFSSHVQHCVYYHYYYNYNYY